jgi:hypothetical protein
MKSDAMNLDMLGSTLKRQFSVDPHAVQNEPGNSLFDFDCFRNLTRQYVGKEDDANRLCELLKAAEDSESRGDFAARSRFLSSYIEEVSSQPRQPLSRGSMMVLITLARTV